MIGFLIFALLVVLAAVVVIYCCDLLLAHWAGIPAIIPTLIRVIVILIALLVCMGDPLGLGGPGFSEPIKPGQNVKPPPDYSAQPKRR